MWCKKRHKFIIELLRPFFNIFLKLKYGLKKTKQPRIVNDVDLNKQIIVLSNHSTTFDPFLVGLHFRQPLYYMASIDLFEHSFIGKAIKFLVNPIPKEKSKKSDLASIKACIRITKEKGSICIFPEGNRTLKGSLGYIDPSIVKLIKSLKLPLVIFNIEGGYGVDPRWGSKTRKGKVFTKVKTALPFDEYNNMSNEELYDFIIKNLSVNDLYSGNLYKSKRKAEYLERVVYICPKCHEMHCLISNKNDITCTKCKFTATYNEDLSISTNDNNIKFNVLEDWYNYQIDVLKNKKIGDELIYKDEITLVNPRLYKSKLKICDGILKMYRDRFEVESKKKCFIFEFDKIEAITLVGKKKMNFYYDNKTYQVFKNKRINLLKYMHLFYIIKNKKEGKYIEFLGL